MIVTEFAEDDALLKKAEKLLYEAEALLVLIRFEREQIAALRAEMQIATLELRNCRMQTRAKIQWSRSN